MEIKFLGGVGTVTGSKYLISFKNKQVLIDCGLFQGLKALRLNNWNPLPLDASKIDAILLTHAHIDHSGYIPLLVKQGFRGKVYCTQATKALCSILLPDSGYLHEEEARYAQKHGYSKHAHPRPLYTKADAENSLTYFETVEWDQAFNLAEGCEISFHYAGHLLGAAHIMIRNKGRSLLFSGDLGRPVDPVMLTPTTFHDADYLVVESTYGDKTHPSTDPKDDLKALINRTLSRKGVVLIPAFAVGRAQLLLYYLYQLRVSGEIPAIPVYLNSPMAISANQYFETFHNEHRLSLAEAREVCRMATYINSVEESKALNLKEGPMIIIAGAGMATGGRILHHLKAFGHDPHNLILFVGFQAEGTRGAAMISGIPKVKIHGEYWPIRAEVAHLDSLSAHADSNEILGWLKHFKRPPSMTFVTHGEAAASKALRDQIEKSLGWRAIVPSSMSSIILD